MLFKSTEDYLRETEIEGLLKDRAELVIRSYISQMTDLLEIYLNHLQF